MIEVVYSLYLKQNKHAVVYLKTISWNCQENIGVFLSETWRSIVKWCSFEVARLDDADGETLCVVIVTQTNVQLTARLRRAHLYTPFSRHQLTFDAGAIYKQMFGPIIYLLTRVD